MFDFFRNLEKKRAFQKALDEIDAEEINAQSEKHTKDTSIQRTYTSKAEEEKTTGFKQFKGVVNRPLTTAVDLKNFKDWRKVETVDSKQPKYDKKSPYEPKPMPSPFRKSPLLSNEDDLKTPSFDQDERDEKIPDIISKLANETFDEGEGNEPILDSNPVSFVNKSAPINDTFNKSEFINSLFAFPKEKTEKDLSAASYIKEQNKKAVKEMTTEELLKSISPNFTPKTEVKSTSPEIEVVDFEEKTVETPNEQRKPAKLAKLKPTIKSMLAKDHLIDKKEEEKQETKVEQKTVEKKEETKKVVEPTKKIEPTKKTATSLPKQTKTTSQTKKPKITSTTTKKRKRKTRFDADVVSSLSWKNIKK